MEKGKKSGKEEEKEKVSENSGNNKKMKCACMWAKEEIIIDFILGFIFLT